MMKPYQKIFLHWLDVVNRATVKQQRDESRLNSHRLAQEPVLRGGLVSLRVREAVIPA